MKHEQLEHFLENDQNYTLKTAREDQIKRLLQDVGFLPQNLEIGAKGEPDDRS